jgi:hypothetical protein
VMIDLQQSSPSGRGQGQDWIDQQGNMDGSKHFHFCEQLRFVSPSSRYSQPPYMISDPIYGLGQNTNPGLELNTYGVVLDRFRMIGSEAP